MDGNKLGKITGESIVGKHDSNHPLSLLQYNNYKFTTKYND